MRERGAVAALLGALAVLGALALLAPRAARASDDPAGGSQDPSEMKGREAFAAGRYDEAIQLFAKLYAHTLNPTYVRNIARCYQKKREPEKAIDEFRDYIAKTRSGKYAISADERDEIQGYIEEMQALRDEQARTAAAAPVVRVAPVAAAPVPSAPPPAAAPTAMLTTTSTSTPTTAPDEDHPLYTRWWFWTIVGVVAVGGAVTVVALSGGTTKPPCTAPGGCQ